MENHNVSIDNLTILGDPVNKVTDKLRSLSMRGIVGIEKEYITPSGQFHYNYKLTYGVFVQITKNKGSFGNVIRKDKPIKLLYLPNKLKMDLEIKRKNYEREIQLYKEKGISLKPSPNFTPDYLGKLKLRSGEEIVETTKQQVNRIRIEFNPNKLTDQNHLIELQSVMQLIKNPYLSRIDIAIDLFHEDLTRIKIIDGKGRKKHVYYSGDWTPETFYIGANKSEQVIRIYNKALEQKINGLDWWRIEVQLRGDKAKIFDKFNPLDSIYLFKEIKGTHDLKPNQRAMLEYLANDQTRLRELSRPAQKQYKDLLKDYSRELSMLSPIQLETPISMFYEMYIKDLKDEVMTYFKYSTMIWGDLNNE